MFLRHDPPLVMENALITDRSAKPMFNAMRRASAGSFGNKAMKIDFIYFSFLLDGGIHTNNHYCAVAALTI